MAVTNHTYTMLAKSMADGVADLDTSTLKVALFSAYTPAVDTQQFYSTALAAATEVSASGYTTGGATLSTVTFTKSSHTYTLDCDDPSWSSVLTASYACFYVSTGTNSTSALICYWDFGGAQSSTAPLFTLNINASGLITITGSG